MKQTTTEQKNNGYIVRINVIPDDEGVMINCKSSFSNAAEDCERMLLRHRHPAYVLMRILQIIDENEIRGAVLTISGLLWAFNGGEFRDRLTKELKSYARLKGFISVDISEV